MLNEPDSEVRPIRTEGDVFTTVADPCVYIGRLARFVPASALGKKAARVRDEDRPELSKCKASESATSTQRVA